MQKDPEVRKHFGIFFCLKKEPDNVTICNIYNVTFCNV